jgi:hypothetical protein
VRAYDSFNNTTRNAELHPFRAGEKYPPASDFTKFTYDPLRAQYESAIWTLKLQGIAYRGVPPQPHVKVKSIDLNASPWPAVVLTDCQTNNENWRVYNVKTGAVLPRTTPSIPPPYVATATVILYKNRWGVSKITVDTSRTCTE